MNTTPQATIDRLVSTTETNSATGTNLATGSRPARPPGRNTGSFATIRPHLEVTGALGDRYDEILTPEVLGFLAELPTGSLAPGTICSRRDCRRGWMRRMGVTRDS